MKAAELFVKALENEGVKFIFGLPGEENLDLLEAIRKSDIKFVICRHEQAAGFMAATYGRLTGNPGVCLSTLGPGASNLVTAAAFAQLGAMPMVMITGQKPLKKSEQGRFQIVDIVEMMEPLTKFAKQIAYPEHIPSLIREAFRMASEERPGAVHLELPEDIAQENVEEFKIFDPVTYKIPSANEEDILKASELIKKAKHPLLLIGAGANRKRACSALYNFIETLQIPFINTQMGKGIVDERNPLYLGTAALSENDFIHQAFLKADLIVNVGHDTIEKPPFLMRDSDDRTVIHINFFAPVIDEYYFPQQLVIGDISHSVLKLKEILVEDGGKWDNQFFNSIKKNVNEHLSKYAEDNRFPILPQRLVKLVRANIPDDAFITLDNGIYKIWFARNFPAYSLNTLLLDNALATMGAGLPAAIACKLIHPDRKVISINGDGGFLMNCQDLETAQRLKLDLLIIILNDSAYGMIKWKQEKMGFADFGLDYSNPDFVMLAESFGAKAYRPNSVEQFEKDFKSALNLKGLQVIDLAIDYSLNHKILNVLLQKYSEENK